MIILRDKIDATIKHHFNGAEREDLTDKQQQWLNSSIEMSVEELLEIFKEYNIK